jgi:3-oxoacyl-[acyl-carrier protein] reductase
MLTRRMLEGQVAIVTGGGGGIGSGIATELARAGCAVAVNDLARSAAAADRTRAAVEAIGAPAVTILGDVSVRADVAKVVDDAVRRLGRLDLFVNNAGVQVWKPLLELEEDEWDRVIDTNLKGCFLCTQAAARYMKDHGGGTIVNIGSGCNKVPFANLVSYTASKGGIEMLTKVSALELGPMRIRVNCVAPGAVEIDRTRLELPNYAEAWGSVTPLRRIGTPEDIGQAVVLLASPAASFITGQTLGVDGGLFNQPSWPKL